MLENDAVVVAAGGYRPPVRRNHGRPNCIGVGDALTQDPTGRGFVEPQSPIVASGHEQLAIRGERERTDEQARARQLEDTASRVGAHED